MAYALSLNALNAAPRFDGDRTLYLSPYKKKWAPGYRERVVVWVNGMATSGESHRRVAMALSEVADSHVLGIYNLKGQPEHHAFEMVMRDILQDPVIPEGFKSGLRSLNTASMFVHDVGQCVRDYLNPIAQSLERQRHTGWGERARYHVMRHMLKYNPAIRSVLEVLNTEVRGAGAVRVVCYSQGNLIVAAAAEALLWIRGGYIGRVHVYALASPARAWPDTLVVKKYTNVQDPITWLSLGESLKRAHVEVADTPGNPTSWLHAHNVGLYIYQSQFVADLRRDLGV